MTKVLLTGASGFIAKNILKELLEQNYDVRATVRSDKRQAEIQALFPEAKIEFVKLDLNKDEGWNSALKGIDVLIHTASPFPLGSPKDPQELIKPAVEGTRRALNAAKNAGVNRVILTSSCAAIYKDSTKPKGQISDETNWSDVGGAAMSPYEDSKTLAEKAAWEFVERHPEIKLTVINPSGVFGAPLDKNYGTSLEIAEQFLTGKLPMVPNLDIPIVDVKDVAKMHVDAIKMDETIGERYAAVANEDGAIAMLDIAKLYAATYPNLKIGTKAMPNWLAKTLSLFVRDMRQLTRSIGVDVRVSGAKAAKTFGITYVTPKQALLNSSEALIAMGKIEPKK